MYLIVIMDDQLFSLKVYILGLYDTYGVANACFIIPL